MNDNIGLFIFIYLAIGFLATVCSNLTLQGSERLKFKDLLLFLFWPLFLVYGIFSPLFNGKDFSE